MVGGLEHFLFIHILGRIIPTDSYFLEGLKLPTSHARIYLYHWIIGFDYLFAVWKKCSLIFVAINIAIDICSYQYLVGGFKHFLFSRIYGIILSIDDLIFFKMVNGYCTTNQISYQLVSFHQACPFCRWLFNVLNPNSWLNLNMAGRL